MSTERWIGVCAAVAVAVTLGHATAEAQPADKRTYFTFSTPVAIPGVTLPAGKYLFRLADTPSRNVVQVLSADGKTPYAQFFVFRAQRFDAPKNPEVRFMETAEGMPPAVQTWWYPLDRTGYEFAYPREQARRLAQGTQQPVLMARAEPPVPPTPPPAPELARVAPSGEETPVAPESVPPPAEPKGRSLEGEVAPPSLAVTPAAPPAQGQQARTTLPKTASTAPAWGLTGLALLALAALVHGIRLRTRKA